ncbi:MAG: hypothetical protein B7Y25_04675 [Alphaproteobacteria bacterium 16-39-46]|nr:MAG: hypothetical protein B7Y25_04675 [Alphaproteobacteria bacterium 16-39-46]OZA42950.1 MAG: hypothetical protein B7X84_04500 [Alphaproteobacteria bacterium 17-39-52]HQS84197.1 hypothetical protein [Alphaproteobacteria bacterium]HQS94045.1 hypothetical protein [Alphaproteobacteria bacterium]
MSPQYVSHFFNITSISQKITEEECFDLFSDPDFYDIENDTSQYKDTQHQKNKKYHRLSTTFLDQNQQLFLGQAEFDVFINEKSVWVT